MRLGLVGVTTLLLAVAPTATHAAKIDGATIEGSQHKIKQVDRTSPRNAGDTVRCPEGKKALTGGAFWHETAVGPDPAISNLVNLTSSFPTLNGRGWYADGQTNALAPRTLTLEVRCVRKGMLDGVKTEHSSKVLPSGTAAAIKARCPEGFVTMAGGGYLSRPGEPARPKTSARGRITSSTLIDSATKWLVVGGNFSEGKLAFHAVARCIREGRIDGVNINYPTATVNSQSTGGYYGSCFGGTRALTGGSAWHLTGEQEPSTLTATTTYLSGNAPTFDVMGHYSAGLNADSVALTLRTAVLCPNL